MKYFILFSLVALISINGFSRQKIKKQHLTYLEYINEYGNDKTSITIINIFFQKREYAGIGKMSFLPLSASVTAVAPPIGIGLMAVSSPLFVSGIITRNKYSHKNLLKALNEYRSNKSLSKNLKKKVIRIHIIEEEIHQIELREARLISLKEIKNKHITDEKNRKKDILSHVSK